MAQFKTCVCVFNMDNKEPFIICFYVSDSSSVLSFVNSLVQNHMYYNKKIYFYFVVPGRDHPWCPMLNCSERCDPAFTNSPLLSVPTFVRAWLRQHKSLSTILVYHCGRNTHGLLLQGGGRRALLPRNVRAFTVVDISCSDIPRVHGYLTEKIGAPTPIISCYIVIKMK